MLEDSLFESQRQKKTRNPMSVAVSAMAHVVTIGALIVIPLFETQALTIPPIDTSLVLPQQVRPQYVPVFRVSPQVRTQTQIRSSTPALTSPSSIPSQIVYVDEPPKPEFNVFHLNSGFGANPSDRGASNSLGVPLPDVTPPLAPLPPPPPPPSTTDQHPIRRGGKVQAANLIYEVKPIYPALAKMTRVQGIVVLEAMISKEGAIESLRVVSGHQLLVRAALDAVSQWKYRPTLLNGEPVEVITTVTVTFTLQ